MIAQVHLVVDATPKHGAAANLDKYRAAKVKSVFQGGKKHSLTGHSFVAQANYATALGRDTTRVVPCNTTSIVRTLGALKSAGSLKKARGVLVRRAADPWESDHSGVMNTRAPEKDIPSHQGSDTQTVIPDLDVVRLPWSLPTQQAIYTRGTSSSRGLHSRTKYSLHFMLHPESAFCAHPMELLD